MAWHDELDQLVNNVRDALAEAAVTSEASSPLILDFCGLPRPPLSATIHPLHASNPSLADADRPAFGGLALVNMCGIRLSAANSHA